MGACLSHGGEHFEPPAPGEEPSLSKVEPRTHGVCTVQVGKGKAETRCVVLMNGALHMHDPCSDPSPDAEDVLERGLHGGEAPTSIPVVGCKLRASGKVSFVVTGPRDLKATYKCPSYLEREAWMLAFQKTPGIFRHIEDYFDIGRVVGQGATSRVYECRSRFSGKVFGIKRRVHKDTESSLSMHNELALLQQFKRHPHPSVPCLEDYFFDSDGHIALVVELMTGGELFERITAEKGFTEVDARRTVAKIAAGIDYLHHQGVAHRDLKPQNIMFADGTRDSPIKIMDYDLAKVSHAALWSASTPCGTTGYMAPEIIDVGNKYGLAVDMWSLGCIVYILLCGKLPFGHDEDTADDLTKKGEFSFLEDQWGGVSEAAKDLVRNLLVVDAGKRLTAAEVLKHPWLVMEADVDPATLPELPREELKKSMREIKEAMEGSIKHIRTAAESQGVVALLEPAKALAGVGSASMVHASSMKLDPTHYPDTVRGGGGGGGSNRPGAPSRSTTLGLGKFFRRDRSSKGGGSSGQPRGSGGSGLKIPPQDSWADPPSYDGGAGGSDDGRPRLSPQSVPLGDWGMSSPNGKGGSVRGTQPLAGSEHLVVRKGSADDLGPIAGVHISPARV